MLSTVMDYRGFSSVVMLIISLSPGESERPKIKFGFATGQLNGLGQTSYSKARFPPPCSGILIKYSLMGIL